MFTEWQSIDRPQCLACILTKKLSIMEYTPAIRYTLYQGNRWLTKIGQIILLVGDERNWHPLVILMLRYSQKHFIEIRLEITFHRPLPPSPLLAALSRGVAFPAVWPLWRVSGTTCTPNVSFTKILAYSLFRQNVFKIPTWDLHAGNLSWHWFNQWEAYLKWLRDWINQVESITGSSLVILQLLFTQISTGIAVEQALVNYTR